MFIFEMNGEVAEEFFRRVSLLEEDNEMNREKILFQMGQEGLIKRISSTNRTKEQYIKDISREYKILDVTKHEDK